MNFALGVVNGVSFDNSRTPFPALATSSLVSLSLKIDGLPPIPCSGTYVGRGQILTASHCFLMNDYPEYKPEICVSGLNAKENCFSSQDYDVLFPPMVEEGPKAPTRKLRKVIKIPKPDLVLVQFHAENLSKFSAFQILSLVQNADTIFTQPENWQILVLGQGCTAYTEPGASDPTPGIGTYRFAPVQLSAELTTGLEFYSVWTKENLNAGLCWGDSGGPLITVNLKSNEQFQLAVNSSTKRTYDRNTGYTASVKSIFSRVDQASTLDWLNKNIQAIK